MSSSSALQEFVCRSPPRPWGASCARTRTCTRGPPTMFTHAGAFDPYEALSAAMGGMMLGDAPSPRQALLLATPEGTPAEVAFFPNAALGGWDATPGAMPGTVPHSPRTARQARCNAAAAADSPRSESQTDAGFDSRVEDINIHSPGSGRGGAGPVYHRRVGDVCLCRRESGRDDGSCVWCPSTGVAPV